MSSRLTLTLPPGLGNTDVAVDTKRFSIGRTPENDLLIEDSSLSRRHALIENFDGRFNLSDCGSSNGTLVNGRVVTGMTELRDWDVLTFGGVGDIVVRLQDDTQPSGNEGKRAATSAAAKSPAIAFSRKVAQASRPSAVSDQGWFSGPVIAVAAAVTILLITGLVLLATRGTNSRGAKAVGVKKQEPPRDNVDDDNRASTPSQSAPSPVTTDPGPVTAGDAALVEGSSIEPYALKVLTGISKDTHPVLTEKPLGEINAQVQRFRGSSSLGQELRAMKRDLSSVAAAAKGSGIRIPLAVYATLARIDKDGGRGEPAPVAGQICGILAKMRTIFGDELANDSLLSVAALEEGPGLQLRITKLAGRVNDSPTTIRSIWYLRDHQVISSDTYDFLLRFMAIGVIAQDPQKFGVAAEPLTF